MESLNSYPFSDNNFDTGINADSFEAWRNSDGIGYVQLAFKVITEAIYDLIAGHLDDHMSASYFFFGTREDSMYWLWASILGTDELPLIVKKHQKGQVDQQDVEYIRNLCTTVKTI
jgi:hypothetical protein